MFIAYAAPNLYDHVTLRYKTRINSNKIVSVSVSEPFFVQKTDLIAELKRTKDIPGIKKLKVERAQVEKTQEQNLMTEISKAFSVTNFVDQVREHFAFFLEEYTYNHVKEIVKMYNVFNVPLKIFFSFLVLLCSPTLKFRILDFFPQIPEKDSSGNVIPIWKRQMLARKAAERAKKELEEQIARENEERRQKAIPPWKRQLLAKKDNEEKRYGI